MKYLIKYYSVNFPFKKENSSFLISKFYEEGFYILWSYDKIENFFERNSFLWIKEEEKRAFEYEYWNRAPFFLDLKVKSELNKEKLKEDIRSFNFFLFYSDFYIKNFIKFNIFFSPTFSNLYKFYSLYISQNNDYLIYFLKQSNIILKKYEFLKVFFLKKNKQYDNYMLFYYNSRIISPLFEYYYLFSLPDNVNILNEKNKSYFLKFIDFFKNWVSLFKLGVKRFFFF
jgi:hypothetical protein